MSRRAGAEAMAAATRVELAPVGPLPEPALLDAARAFEATGRPVRPGDLVGGLVVLGVEPAPGAELVAATRVDIRPEPRRSDAPLVDILVLLDGSESMGFPWDADHSRSEAALAAVRSFLREPGPSVGEVSIHLYARDVRTLAGPAPVRDLRLADVGAPRGPSFTAHALDVALAALAGRSRPDRAQAILLLTDGVGEVPELLDAALRAGRLLVPVHALVFAPEVDEVFEEVARASGGSVQQASHPLTIEFIHAPGG